MIVVGRTISYLVSSANGNSADLGGKTVLVYPDRYIPSPLTQTLFVLGIKSIKMGERKTDENGQVIVPARRDVYTEYSLNVYSPHAQGGEACIYAFDKWMDYLIRTLGYDVISVGSEGIEYNREAGANVFKGTFVLKRISYDDQQIVY